MSRKPRLARTNPGNAEPQLGTNEERPAGAQQSQVQRGWYSKGYLPHSDFPGLVQMITYRLADSLPAGDCFGRGLSMTPIKTAVAEY